MLFCPCFLPEFFFSFSNDLFCFPQTSISPLFNNPCGDLAIEDWVNHVFNVLVWNSAFPFLQLLISFFFRSLLSASRNEIFANLAIATSVLQSFLLDLTSSSPADVLSRRLPLPASCPPASSGDFLFTGAFAPLQVGRFWFGFYDGFFFCVVAHASTSFLSPLLQLFAREYQRGVRLQCFFAPGPLTPESPFPSAAFSA